MAPPLREGCLCAIGAMSAAMEEAQVVEPAQQPSADAGDAADEKVQEGVPPAEEYSVEMTSLGGERCGVPVTAEVGISVDMVLEAQVFKDWVADIDKDPKLFVRARQKAVDCVPTPSLLTPSCALLRGRSRTSTCRVSTCLALALGLSSSGPRLKCMLAAKRA